MTSIQKMPLQIKIVLAVVWLELILSGFIIAVLLRSFHSDYVRHIVEIVVGLVYLFCIFVNYRFAKGARWAHRYLLFCTGISVVKFIYDVATGQNIPTFGYVGFVVSVGVIFLLLSPSSVSFYQKRS